MPCSYSLYILLFSSPAAVLQALYRNTGKGTSSLPERFPVAKQSLHLKRKIRDVINHKACSETNILKHEIASLAYI